jgi:phage terminase large subunit
VDRRGAIHNKRDVRLLAPTIRGAGGEIWASFNPKSRTDYLYTRFVENTPKNAIVRKINYTENPFLSSTLLEDIENYKSDPDFAHIYLGEVANNNALTFFTWEDLEACLVDAQPTDAEETIIGLDIADAGEDKNAIAVNKDYTLTHIEEFKGELHKLNRTYDKAIATYKKHKATLLIYDGIGVGAGAGSYFADTNKTVKFSPFMAGGKVKRPNGYYMPLGKASKIKNTEAFANLKAQAWQEVADKIKAKEIKILKTTNYKQLFNELIEVRKVLKGEKAIMVEQKSSLLKRGIKSPNLADAFIMAFAGKPTNALLASR